MHDKLVKILEYSSESYNIDFKKTEYNIGKHPKRNEFLKDMCAMANHPSDEPKYIFIGVKEKNGLPEDFIEIESITDQAKYQQFLQANIEPAIKFDYISFDYRGKSLACYILQDNNERPYLFKKNVQNPSDNLGEYKIGDGFIRAGTSTRKLERKDFELIYNDRSMKRDRRSDLEIYLVLLDCHDELLRNDGFKLFDFNIRNISKKSISFDVELNIYHNEDYFVLKKFDVEQDKIEEARTSRFSSALTFNPQRIDPTFMDLSIDHFADHTRIVRDKRHNQTNSISIAQEDVELYIFLKEIIFKRSPSTLIAELILRSDDFIEGAFKERFTIDLT